MLVKNRLKLVKKPVTANTFLAPNLSSAQPPRMENRAERAKYTEKIDDVVALPNKKSFCKDLKNTPKEKRTPKATNPIIKRDATTTHR